MRHVLGANGQRLTLIGPSGVGKTTMARSLAEILGLPRMLIEVGNLAETNWKGRTIRDHLATLHGRAAENARLGDMDRAVVFLDEIDKVQTPEGEGASSQSYHKGKQQSLLAVLGGDQKIWYSPSGEEPFTEPWSSSSALVIAAGVFDGLPGEPPTPQDLVEWGMMPELVERMGQLIRLQPLDREQLTEVIRREASDLADTFRTCGYQLRITRSALNGVAERIRRCGEKAGPRSGATWLRQSAIDGLIRLLEEDASPGTELRLTGSDLDLPATRPERTIGF